MVLTKEQRTALKRKWERDSQGMSYLMFRRTVVQKEKQVENKKHLFCRGHRHLRWRS
jgi:hypothetical protein